MRAGWDQEHMYYGIGRYTPSTEHSNLLAGHFMGAWHLRSIVQSRPSISHFPVSRLASTGKSPFMVRAGESTGRISGLALACRVVYFVGTYKQRDPSSRDFQFNKNPLP
jgi:hypothetical protein